MSNIIRRRTTRVSAALATAAISLGVAAGPASAQQSGLVNVDVTNVLNNNQVAVTVPVQAAAGICGVDVNVLSSLPSGTTFNNCPARNGNQSVTVTQP
jgi:hypothetical protein